jgi:spore germination cell wall hydrolase CwlJ-like protein
LKFSLWTRASTRALILLVGTSLGVAFGATCLADGSDHRADAPRAYARALQSGYAAGKLAAQHLGPNKPASTRALNCLTAAVYYEARGEGPAGRAAVAQVVLNRTRSGDYPRTICAVVYQGSGQGQCQFSFVCNGAMKAQREAQAWADARRVAEKALRGYVMAAVGKATCFHASGTQAGGRGVRLGRQVFYANS